MKTVQTNRLAPLLLVMEQCNPLWPSVPQVAFQIYQHLRRLTDVRLVTHARNEEGMRQYCPGAQIEFIKESEAVKAYYRIVSALVARGGTNWPLLHVLGYPVYADFDRKVYRRYAERVRQGSYSAVMAMSPVLPRYPYSISQACEETPFILGPVNGGLPFPKGFRRIAWQEHAHFNFLRSLGRMLPGYAATYHRASRILVGSRFTEEWLKQTFPREAKKLVWMPENGIPEYFFQPEANASSCGKTLTLLFAGRLVPYKGGDLVIDAAALAQARLDRQIELIVVGSGPEREKLESRAISTGLRDHVRFTGAVPPAEMPAYFRKADLFCFPSIREFGGAVVLEAMASAIPCIVVDHGGIGEYVTPGSGIKIAPHSRDHIVRRMADAIVDLGRDDALRADMARRAQERAREFTWAAKAERMLAIIEEVIGEQSLSRLKAA